MLSASAMVVTGHRKKAIYFIILGAIMVALAVTLNVGWIVINWRTGVMLVLGVLFFGALIVGVVLNTIFLVREIRRNEQHDAFINAVTHELKTPVASIRLYLETLLRRDIEEPKRKEFYGIMLADSERLLSTIEQVLRAGRLGPTKLPLNRFRVDLRETVMDCRELAVRRHHLPAEAIRVEERLRETGSTTVIGDSEELHAAISNLLENAIKYSGPRVKVVIELATVEDNRIAIKVHDEGVGIPRPELRRIFKRFYRIPGTVAAKVKGTGLGLYIVQSVAERHGGRAYAESEGAGMGSTFTVELPTAPAQAKVPAAV